MDLNRDNPSIPTLIGLLQGNERLLAAEFAPRQFPYFFSFTLRGEVGVVFTDDIRGLKPAQITELPVHASDDSLQVCFQAAQRDVFKELQESGLVLGAP